MVYQAKNSGFSVSRRSGSISAVHPGGRLRTLLVVPLLLCGFSAQGAIDPGDDDLYERALQEMNQGEYNVAVIHLKNLLQKDPNNIPARISLGRAYLRQGYGNAAEKELRIALGRGADMANVVVALGNALLLQRKYQTILDDIRADTMFSAPSVEALTLRGRANYELNNLNDAANEFDKAISVGPEEVNPLLGRALVAAARGKWDIALENVDAALTLQPDNGEAIYQKAGIARARRNFQRAIDLYGRVLKQNPNHMRARVGRASLSLSLGDLVTARNDAKFVSERSVSDISAEFILWQSLLRLGQKEEAVAAFEKASSRLGEITDDAINDSPSLLRIVGLIAYAKKDYELANRHFRKIVKENPHDFTIQRLYGEVQLRLDNVELAERILFRLAKSRPDDADVQSLLGEAYLRLNKYDGAASALEKASALSPHTQYRMVSRLALSKIGAGRTELAMEDLRNLVTEGRATVKGAMLLTSLQIRRGDLDGALETVNSLAKLNESSALVSNLNGVVMLARGDRAQARAAFEFAIASAPNYTPAIYNLAQMEVEANNFEAAVKGFERILEVDPRSSVAALGLAEIARLQGNPGGVINFLEKAVAINPEDKKPFVELIDEYLNKSRFTEASRVVQSLADKHYDSMEAFEMTARLSAAQGKIQDARLNYRRAKEAAGYSGADLLRIARRQVELKDYKGAHLTLIKAMQSERAYDATAAAIRLDLRSGNLERARRTAEEFKTANRRSPLAHIVWGEYLMSVNEFEHAVESYRSALKLETANPHALLGLVHALFARGDYDLGLDELKAWLRVYPDNHFVRRELALRLINLQRLTEAQTELEGLASLPEQDPLTLVALARCYQLNGDDRARRVAEKAYELRPDWSKSADTLGWILVTEGEVKKGLKLLRDAFSRDKNNLIRFHIAVALSELERYAESKQELQVILRTSADSPWAVDAKELLAIIEKRM